MHDIEISEEMLRHPAVDLVVSGVDHFAEVRINGEAVFDCDGSELTYRKEVIQHLRVGFNRIEILFLEQDNDWLLDGDLCPLGEKIPRERDSRLGIWAVPYLHFISNVRLDYISTEQIWHYSGGCELRIDLFYQVYASGLVSAKVRFDGVTYQIPLDIRNNQATAIFQIEAPKTVDDSQFYLLQVELGEQVQTHQVGLHPSRSANHFPIL